MPVSPEQAIANARAKSRPGAFATGTRLMQVHDCYRVGAKDPSAPTAVLGAHNRHKPRSAGTPSGAPEPTRAGPPLTPANLARSPAAPCSASAWA